MKIRQLLLVAALCGALRAETLALRKTFVQTFMNKATIAATMEVDVHPDTPHSISNGGNDGDIHMAGRAPEVGLPFVAEIMNARLEPAALASLKQTSSSPPVKVVGVWRIWFEHPGTAPQVQGAAVPKPGTSNPDHLFEIHPITSFGAIGVLDSLQPVQGYTAYPAKTAFQFYESDPATISANSTAITLAASEGKYNYAEFVMELAGQPQDVGDGLIVLATVFDASDPEEPVTAAPRRMVFVKGSAPAVELLKHSAGDTIHVLGVPRVCLAEVSAIADTIGSKTVSVNLPYEMIVVAVLP